MTKRAVSTVRIDLPLRREARLFLFVQSPDSKSGLWWSQLFAQLTTLEEAEPHWEFEPEQEVFYARRPLSAAESQQIIALLSAAPEDVVQSNRTLRKMIGILGEAEVELGLSFFARANPLQDR